MILVVLLAAWEAGCDVPGQPKTSARYTPPQGETSFEALFKQNCVGCHGQDGELGPAPPLSNKLFLALIPDAELQRVITEGRAGTLMPAFAASEGGHLTSEQVQILSTGIMAHWRAAESPAGGAPPYLLPQAPLDGVRAADRAEGVKVFARACSSCHGDHGQGGQNGDEPVGAINDPDFLALISDQALRRYVITGRPDLGMPDYAGSTGRAEGFAPLTSQEVTDVVAYVASWRQGGSNTGRGN
jgi:cytochrome c oxidase cbb3-type subunit 3